MNEPYTEYGELCFDGEGHFLGCFRSMWQGKKYVRICYRRDGERATFPTEEAAMQWMTEAK